MMDAETAKRFNALLKEEPESLSEANLNFLRSRASYLTTDERRRFADVLGDPQPEAQTASDGEPEAEETKKSKKK